MMQTLRKVTVVALFGILIVAFALWGVNDFTGRNGQQALASVGGREITPQQFQRTYQRTLDEASSEEKRRLTPQEARLRGLPDRALQTLIQGTALDVEAEALGLGVSEAALRDTIFRIKAFQDKDGKFDPVKYTKVLAGAGENVQNFERGLRTDLIRSQLQGIFAKSAVVPQVLEDAMNRYFSEERTLTYFSIDGAAAGTVPAPSDADLRAFYEDRKRQFMTPELRKISVLAITPETVRNKVPVTDADARTAFEASPENYASPERRKIEIIPFQTKSAAQTASLEIQAGKDFLDVARAAGYAESDLDLDLVSRPEFAKKFPASDAMVNAAFALEKGQVSAPVEGPLSTAIIRVLAIIPAGQPAFEDVKDRVVEKLQKERVAQETAKLSKQMEEERLNGTALPEIARKLGLQLTDVTLDTRGNGPDGKGVTVAGVAGPTWAGPVFKSDVGVENEAIRLPGSGYAWFEVQDIVKARQKTFEEVETEVKAAQTKEVVRKALADVSRGLVSKIESGQAIADVAKSVNAQMKTSRPLKREDVEPGLPRSAVKQAFALAEGGAGSAAIGEETSRAVFQLTGIAPPTPLPAEAETRLRQQLGSLAANDNLTQYLSAIKKRAGVTVDKTAFARAAGGADLE